MYNEDEYLNRMIIISDNLDYDYYTRAPWSDREESDLDLDNDYDDWPEIVGASNANAVTMSEIVESTANVSLNPPQSSSQEKKKKSKSKRKNKQAKKKQASMPGLDDAPKDDTEVQEAKSNENPGQGGSSKAVGDETKEKIQKEAAGSSKVIKKPKPKT